MKTSTELKKESTYKRPITFLFSWRPFSIYELISYALMYASVPMLAYGIEIYNSEIVKIIILTVLTLYSGFFAALIWNDLTDRDIDKIVHPKRPTAEGSISFKKFFSVALVFSALTFIFAILVSVWCLILVGAAALFVTFHNKYMKKIVRFPAYSEIFTPVQWIIVAIFGFFAIWTTSLSSGNIIISFPLFGYISFQSIDFQNMIILVLFTYFADNAHDLPEGIHDVKGDRALGVKTYATSFGEKNAAKISFAMFFVSGIFGILLYLRTILTPIFLIPFLIFWIYILYCSHKLIKSDKKNIKEMGKIIGRKGFNYFLFSYNLIFLDVLIQVLNFHYNII